MYRLDTKNDSPRHVPWIRSEGVAGTSNDISINIDHVKRMRGEWWVKNGSSVNNEETVLEECETRILYVGKKGAMNCEEKA